MNVKRLYALANAPTRRSVIRRNPLSSVLPMNRSFVLAVFLALGACSSGTPQPIDPPLSSEQAAKALNEQFADRNNQVNDPFGRTHAPPTPVSVESIGSCTGDAIRVLCKVAYASPYRSEDHVVLFWKTANPRRPWRAALVERSGP